MKLCVPLFQKDQLGIVFVCQLLIDFGLFSFKVKCSDFFCLCPKCRMNYQVKKNRDAGSVDKCLVALEESARSGQGNLLELAVSAARARYYVGQVSM